MEKSSVFSREGYLEENYRLFHLRDTAGQERDFHFHEFNKIVLLISGRVDYAVEDRVYSLKPWQVLLIKHHTIHKAIIDKKEPYERIIIYLDRNYCQRIMPEEHLTECFDTADRSGQHLLLPSGEQISALNATLSAFETNRDSRDFGTKAMADTLMLQLLILLNRISSSAPQTLTHERDIKIERALSYINENLTSELNVDVIAEQVYLSKYHFMRLFKESVGSTVHQYIRQKRLLYAARMIREGVNANKAAADAGFADYSTFHRAFKASFGISPGDLKK